MKYTKSKKTLSGLNETSLVSIADAYKMNSISGICVLSLVQKVEVESPYPSQRAFIIRHKNALKNKPFPY